MRIVPVVRSFWAFMVVTPLFAHNPVLPPKHPTLPIPQLPQPTPQPDVTPLLMAYANSVAWSDDETRRDALTLAKTLHKRAQALFSFIRKDTLANLLSEYQQYCTTEAGSAAAETVSQMDVIWLSGHPEFASYIDRYRLIAKIMSDQRPTLVFAAGLVAPTRLLHLMLASHLLASHDEARFEYQDHFQCLYESLCQRLLDIYDQLAVSVPYGDLWALPYDTSSSMPGLPTDQLVARLAGREAPVRVIVTCLPCSLPLLAPLLQHTEPQDIFQGDKDLSCKHRRLLVQLVALLPDRSIELIPTDILATLPAKDTRAFLNYVRCNAKDCTDRATITCKNCQKAEYCSAECQSKSRQQHKAKCRKPKATPSRTQRRPTAADAAKIDSPAAAETPTLQHRLVDPLESEITLDVLIPQLLAAVKKSPDQAALMQIHEALYFIVNYWNPQVSDTNKKMLSEALYALQNHEFLKRSASPLLLELVLKLRQSSKFGRLNSVMNALQDQIAKPSNQT